MENGTNITSIFTEKLRELNATKLKINDALNNIINGLDEIVGSPATWDAPTTEYFNQYVSAMYTVISRLDEDIDTIYNYLKRVPENASKIQSGIINFVEELF